MGLLELIKREIYTPHKVTLELSQRHVGDSQYMQVLHGIVDIFSFAYNSIFGFVIPSTSFIYRS